MTEEEALVAAALAGVGVGSIVLAEWVARTAASHILQAQEGSDLEVEVQQMPHPGDGWQVHVRGSDGSQVCVAVWPEDAQTRGAG